MGDIEERVECVVAVPLKGFFVETMGSDGNVNGKDGWGCYW